MAKSAVTKTDTSSPLGENTKLTIVVPKATHQAAYQKVLNRLAQRAQLQGFRKGKAPHSLVEQTIGPGKIIEQALEDIVPALYADAVKAAGISPLVQPKIEATKLDKNEDFELVAQTAVAPIIKLGAYQDVIKKAGKEFPKEHEKMHAQAVADGATPHEHSTDDLKKEKMSYILQQLIAAISPKIAPLLLEHELNHQLEQFLSHLATHRIELEQYLKHSGKTIEDIRQEYSASALASLQVEFILQAITADMDPAIDQSEVEKLLGDTAKMSQKAKDRLTQEALLVLKRRKVVEKIEELAA